LKIALIRLRDSEVLDPNISFPQNLIELGTQVRRGGHIVEIFDFNTLSMTYADLEGYDVYGLSVITPLWPEAVRCAQIIRTTNPRCWIIAGGRHLTYVNDIEQLSIFDAVFRGEADISLPAFLAQPSNGIINQRLINNLDSLHPLDFGLIDVSLYRRRKIQDISADTLLISRGCSYRCAFCATTHTKVRTLSPEAVEAMIIALNSSAVYFADDTFTLVCSSSLLDILKVRRLLWGCLGRADHITNELAQKFHQCGCRYMFIGVESGSQQILDKMRKSETVQQIEKALWILHVQKIHVKVSIIVGFPGETWDTLAQTIAFLKRVPFDTIAINSFVPYPGCDVYRNPQKYGISILKDFSLFRQTNKKFSYQIPYENKDMETMFNTMCAEFQDRRQYYNDSQYQHDQLSSKTSAHD
jgi:radical SAM superfamily enzyme YgiQ (UPF0313 family)